MAAANKGNNDDGGHSNSTRADPHPSRQRADVLFAPVGGSDAFEQKSLYMSEKDMNPRHKYVDYRHIDRCFESEMTKTTTSTAATATVTAFDRHNENSSKVNETTTTRCDSLVLGLGPGPWSSV